MTVLFRAECKSVMLKFCPCIPLVNKFYAANLLIKQMFLESSYSSRILFAIDQSTEEILTILCFYIPTKCVHSVHTDFP